MDGPDKDRPDDRSGDATAEQETPTARMLSWARNSTLYRLSRRMHTQKQLEEAIARKAREKFDGIGEVQIKAICVFAVQVARDLNVLDDSHFAEVASRTEARNGRSRRAIARKLSVKGIDRETVAAAVAEVDDLQAAIIFARKRAFGPFRRDGGDESRQARELAAFARAGFGFDIGKRVSSMSREEAEDALAGTRHW